jgi:metal-dependent amidase/aminoacylase/carboxypeptidase family protein
MLRKVHSLFSIGTLIEDNQCSLHRPRFDIDERAMPVGAAILTEAALQYLPNQPGKPL